MIDDAPRQRVVRDPLPFAPRVSTVTRMPVTPTRRPWRGTAAALIVVLASGTAYRLISASRSPVRLALVPFENQTGSSDLDPFIEDLSNAVVAVLAENRSVAIINKTATLPTAGAPSDLAGIRRSLGAEYIVAVQIRPSGDGPLVVTKLIRAHDQTPVWVRTTAITGRPHADIEDETARELGIAVGMQLAKR